MKKISLLAIILLSCGISQAQQAPTLSNPPNGGQHNPDFWSRAGNSGNGGNTNNIFGTKWNSPIYTVTGGLSNASFYRTKLNGVMSPGFQYTINTSIYGNTQTTINTTGYMFLGFNDAPQTFYANKGAFSLFHLNGNSNNPAFIQEGGFRPWMKTGITFTDNQDRAYIGYRCNSG